MRQTKQTKKTHNVPLHKQQLLEALEKTHGIVKHACDMVGLSQKTFYDYCKADPEFKKAVTNYDEQQINFVESKLFENISAGDKASIMFYMRYKGRKRGYTDQIDVNVSGSIEIVTKWGDEIKPNDGTEENKS